MSLKREQLKKNMLWNVFKTPYAVAFSYNTHNVISVSIYSCLRLRVYYIIKDSILPEHDAEKPLALTQDLSILLEQGRLKTLNRSLLLLFYFASLFSTDHMSTNFLKLRWISIAEICTLCRGSGGLWEHQTWQQAPSACHEAAWHRLQALTTSACFTW